FNFNRQGVETAQKHGKTLLGFSDVHYLWQLGRTYTWIYAEPDTFSILNAIRNGQIRLETSPLSWPEAASWWMDRYWKTVIPANSPPDDVSDKIEDRRRFGAA
ncbi:MAG: PHP-associated domain-containing protein, partial [Acidobacteriota bacterium]